MPQLISQPQNTNFLQSTKFILAFSRISNTQYFCQEINLPGISMNEATYPTPFVDLPIPGDKLIYEPLNVTFIVDEELQSWIEIHNWLRGMTFPTNFDEYKNLKNLSSVSQYSPKPQYADGILSILSALNNPKTKIHFNDIFPTSLSAIQFNSTDNDTPTITATATFRYSWYNISKD
jgi:hypothetical protein